MCFNSLFVLCPKKFLNLRKTLTFLVKKKNNKKKAKLISARPFLRERALSRAVFVVVVIVVVNEREKETKETTTKTKDDDESKNICCGKCKHLYL